MIAEDLALQLRLGEQQNDFFQYIVDNNSIELYEIMEMQDQSDFLNEFLDHKDLIHKEIRCNILTLKESTNY